MESGTADEAADRALTSVARKLDKALSVEYTVNELIAEATDTLNLATMFAGMLPFRNYDCLYAYVVDQDGVLISRTIQFTVDKPTYPHRCIYITLTVLIMYPLVAFCYSYNIYTMQMKLSRIISKHYTNYSH